MKISCQSARAFRIFVPAALLASVSLATGCDAQRTRTADRATQEKVVALKELRDSGVISEQEYQARVAALQRQPGGATTTPTQTSSKSTQAHIIQDAVYGVPFGALMLPAGWVYNGGVIHANTCAVSGPSPAFAGQSPDGAYGLIVFPQLLTGAVNDRQVTMQMRQAGCIPAAPSNAGEFVRVAVLPRLGLPNLRVDGVTPDQGLQAQVMQMRQQQQQFDAMSVQDQFHRNQTNIDASDVRVSFEANGRAMNGVVRALTSCKRTQTFFPGGSQVLESRECQAFQLIFFYAPAGELDQLINNKTIDVQQNPAWLAINQLVLTRQGQQIAAAGQAMLAQTQHDIQAHQEQIFNNWKKSSTAQREQYDAQNRAFLAHIGDYNDYTDQATGKTYRASNQYSNTYMNTNGSVMLQANQAGSPGVDWSLMVPKFR